MLRVVSILAAQLFMGHGLCGLSVLQSRAPTGPPLCKGPCLRPVSL
jgi:hypothetical protein